MRTAQRPYTAGEDDYIRANYSSMRGRDIARHLGRQLQSLRKRAQRIGASRAFAGWSEAQDEAIRRAHGHRGLGELSRDLGRSRTAVASRAKKLGIEKWKAPSGRHAGRKIEGFVNGTPVYEHRAVVERRIGRLLRSDEIVHHIDFNKDNNADANLHLFASRADHRRTHMSFERIVPLLMERGCIRFNPDTGNYELCEISR